jgi:SAM-dependent methyltransferase
MRLLRGIIEAGDSLPTIQYTGTDLVEPSLGARQSLGEKYRFAPIPEVRSKHVDSYDAVVLMNVLHETSVNSSATIIEDIRRCLKQKGTLLLVDMGVLPEGEPLALPFYSWDMPFLFREFSDECFTSPSGIPVLALEVPRQAIRFYPQALAAIRVLMATKRDAFSEMACMLSTEGGLRDYSGLAEGLRLGESRVFDLGLLMLLSGHANFRLMEEARREPPAFGAGTDAAVALLRAFFDFWDERQQLVTAGELFDRLGSSVSYESLWYAMDNMSNNIGTFFVRPHGDLQSAAMTPSESLDAFQDSYQYEDIGRMGLARLQLECHRRCWPDG